MLGDPLGIVLAMETIEAFPRSTYLPYKFAFLVIVFHNVGMFTFSTRVILACNTVIS